MRRLRLGRKASERLQAGHVWVYRTEFADQLTPDSLETALLVDERGRLLGSALVDASSPVPARLYSRRERAFDGDWVRERLSAAAAWRRQILSGDVTGYRLAHSEADWLPGLVIDRFGDSFALQLNMQNYLPLQPEILEQLTADFGQLNCVVAEVSGKRLLWQGEADSAKSTYHFNSLQFESDLLKGPKTGAFLDQRENYQVTANWIEKLQVRKRGLDLYSSSGGFALHMAMVQESVEAVDSSAGAIERIRSNAKRNGINNIKAYEGDVRQYLKGLGTAHRYYDCVVVDPPAYAKQGRMKAEASRAYFELNVKAMNAVSPGGLLVSCSCSRAVSEGELLEIIRQAAAETRKSLTLLERRGQALDHRVLVEIPETSYLKCFYFAVNSNGQ